MSTVQEKKIKELNAAIKKMQAENKKEFAVFDKKKKKNIFEKLFSKSK